MELVAEQRAVVAALHCAGQGAQQKARKCGVTCADAEKKTKVRVELQSRSTWRGGCCREVQLSREVHECGWRWNDATARKSLNFRGIISSLARVSFSLASPASFITHGIQEAVSSRLDHTKETSSAPIFNDIPMTTMTNPRIGYSELPSTVHFETIFVNIHRNLSCMTSCSHEILETWDN